MNQNDGLEGLLHQYIRNAQAGVFTAMPARVLKADLSEQKVDVQLLQNRLNTDDTSTERPPILSVPLMFQGSKSSQFSFPVSAGDTVLIVFGMRDIDRFKAGSSQAHDPRTNRKYNRQDAIAIPGLFSFNQARNNPSKHSLDHSTDDAVVVSNIGTSNENEVRLKASGDIIINSPSKVEVNCTTAEVNASESVTIDTPETTVTGSLRVEGMLTYVAGMTGSGGSSTATITGDVVVTGEVVSNGVVLDSHTHNGVETGSGNTGSPN